MDVLFTTPRPPPRAAPGIRAPAYDWSRCRAAPAAAWTRRRWRDLPLHAAARRWPSPFQRRSRARPLQQLLVLLPRLGEQGLALLVGERLRLRQHLLRLGFGGGDGALVLLQQPGGLGPGALRLLDLLLDTALAILHRLEEGRPAEPPEQREQDPEDHDGPEDQPRVDGEGRELPFLDQQQRQHLEQLEQQGENERRETHAFDQRRSQDHGAADVARRFGLTRDRLHRLAADATDAEPYPDHRQPQPEAGAQQRVGVLGRGGEVRAGRLSTLKQRH